MIFQIIIAAILLFLVFGVFIFNRLVSLKMRVKEAWSDIEVQLKRRHDLIPNLVETVKGYATHEKEVFEKVTQARNQALGAQNLEERSKAENFLSQTLKSLFAVVENYPELKAATNFLELQRELRDTEDKIQAARRFYNTNVMELNTAIETFPSNLIANLFNFKKEQFFELENPSEKEAPKVSF
jgi:LemA protein